MSATFFVLLRKSCTEQCVVCLMDVTCLEQLKYLIITNGIRGTMGQGQEPLAYNMRKTTDVWHIKSQIELFSPSTRKTRMFAQNGRKTIHDFCAHNNTRHTTL